MAQTILEDYIKHTGNHFKLAYDIPRRAREIQRRGDALVAERSDKPIVIALREISEREFSREESREEASMPPISVLDDDDE